MGVPELAFVVATVLAAVGVLPQCLRLGRTRDHEGVSLTGATLAVVTETAWLAFMVEGHIWTAVTMPVLMVLANAVLVYCIVRAGSELGSSISAGALWIAVLAAVGRFGGWTAFGVLLGVSYAVQVTPTIYAAYHSALPSGIAPRGGSSCCAKRACGCSTEPHAASRAWSSSVSSPAAQLPRS